MANPADIGPKKPEVENASALRKQELLFAILKNVAARGVEIIGEGVIEAR